MNFFKTIKKFGEKLGLDKLAKRMLGLSDEEYDEASDIIDESSDSDIENKLGIDTLNPGYRIGKAAVEFGDWGKEQVEASTGSSANKTNKTIAEQNRELEREKFDYDRALQERLFEREDTANQRTVNDMRLAGLNPLNMQGTNGAGEVVSTKAPQNSYLENPQNNLQLIDTFFNSALQAKATQSNNSLQQANANLLNAQAENQRIKNIYEADILSGTRSGIEKDNMSKQLSLLDSQRNFLFNSLMGWTDNMPDWLKQNSIRFNYAPIGVKLKRQDFYDAFQSSAYSTYGLNNNALNNVYFDKENMQQQLLSDELLTGTMGIFGTLMKFLIGGK